MRTVAGMQPPLGGHVSMDGHDVHAMTPRERAKRLAVVLTEKESAGLLTAYALVALGRHPHTGWTGRLVEKDHDTIRWAMEQVGAEPFANRYVSDLSDGERQRVMMARALAQEPRTMVLDEITAFLDLPRRVDIMRLLRSLARRTDRAILVSTHDLDLALRTADRIWLMPKGRPLRAGAPEDLVLNGSFAETFAAEGVSFDEVRGAFQVHHHFVGEVELVGDGLARNWTARALEREAVRVWDGASAHPGVRVAIGSQGWRLEHGGIVAEFEQLYDLVQAIRRRFSAIGQLDVERIRLS
jgi:iron complex transport system ATP-binding protein